MTISQQDVQLLEEAYDNINTISGDINQEYLLSISSIMRALNKGVLRSVDKIGEQWQANLTAKKAILLALKLWPCELIDGSYDKIPLKFKTWSAIDFATNKIRCLPGAIVRYSAYIANNVVLMPCMVNVGAYIGSGTMIDTWSTVGSCAYIGENCHISGGVGIGGVLEPIQGKPVVIEDNCFIGARCEIAEGVEIGCGSVLGMGVKIGKSTRIINRMTGETMYGRVPKNSVVVAGSYPSHNFCNINCAIIAKEVDVKTLSKTQINDLLRFDD